VSTARQSTLYLTSLPVESRYSMSALANYSPFVSNSTRFTLGDLDDGEAESLAYLTKQPVDFLISSGDAIVYRVLGNLGRRDQGLSLEEILQKIGLGRNLDWPYSKAFREKYTRGGEVDMIQGKGKQ